MFASGRFRTVSEGKELRELRPRENKFWRLAELHSEFVGSFALRFRYC
jgi:hypothetical protein